jgi:hypothetical protein
MSVMKFSEYNAGEYNTNEGSKFPKIAKTLHGFANVKTVGILTAENPMGERTSSVVNKINMDSMKEILKLSRFGYRDIVGKYGNWEKSVIVNDIPKEEVERLGHLFGQEAVIFGEKTESGFRFEYLERAGADAPYEVKDVRGDVRTTANNRKDYFSQSEPALAKNPRKFFIPFFDEEEAPVAPEVKGTGSAWNNKK